MSEDPEIAAIQRFVRCMRRVLVEYLQVDPKDAPESPAALLGYVESIRDDWEAPADVLAAAGAVARHLRGQIAEVTAAALARRPREGEQLLVPMAELTRLSEWLEGELADLDQLRARQRQR